MKTAVFYDARLSSLVALYRRYRVVFLTLVFFFARGPPLSSIYLCGPQHFVEAVTVQKKLHMYSNSILNVALFLNIMFSYNTFFSYTSKNILLIIGLVLSVFVGHDEHLQDSECPVAVWPVISEIYLSAQYQGCYILFTPNNSPS